MEVPCLCNIYLTLLLDMWFFCCCVVFFFFFVFLPFLGLLLRHMEVPRLGVESQL